MTSSLAGLARPEPGNARLRPELGVEWLAKVVPGEPPLATEKIDFVAVPAGSSRGTEGSFALRVVGESMLDAGVSPVTGGSPRPRGE
jgi:SOS-response transcriptional repressor LexA